MKKLQQTTDKAFPIVPRLIAGGILTVFSLMHFSNPKHFADIMTAAGFPMVDLNVWAASATELMAGILLLSGFLTRVGGLLGCLLYTSPSPRDRQKSRMPSSA